MNNRFSYQRLLATTLTIIYLLNIFPPSPSVAARKVVHAVLFFSPTCGHCHKVMTQDLPPLKEKFGAQLAILEVNIAEEQGLALYRAALEQFHVPRERMGVPALFVGAILLVGSQEIPEQFPRIIEDGLKNNGIDWPYIPGLEEYRSIYYPQEEPQEQELPVFIQRFLRDPAGNTISVLALIAMILSVIAVGLIFLKTSVKTASRSVPEWVVPVLCIIGLGVAGYLSYVEIFQVEAMCGPVGDCNTVQQSTYAKLWGVLPVGVLGVIGYTVILVTWLVKRFGSNLLSSYAALGMWGMAFLGTLFSIYLTFLEPFVIGATCAWCVTSAILITLLLWSSTKAAVEAVAILDEEVE